MLQVHRPLLSPGDEGEGKERHAFLGTADDSTSSGHGDKTLDGWCQKAACWGRHQKGMMNNSSRLQDDIGDDWLLGQSTLPSTNA